MRRGKEKLHRPEYMEQMNAETPAEMATTLMQGVIDSEDPPQARSPRRPLLPTSFLPCFERKHDGRRDLLENDTADPVRSILHPGR